MYRQRNKLITRYRGLSTDDKPQGAEHGSSFHEMDTGTIYYFDQEHEEWYEAPGSRKFEPEEKTATGSVASFETDLVRPMRSVTVQMEPIQDLHGQDAPYPGGGGKNLLEVTATSQTLNGVTFTVNADGTVTANGTATATAFFELIASSISFTESTILNGCPSGGGGDKYAIQLNGIVPLEVGSGITIAADTTITSVSIRVASGTTLNNVVFKPMIRLASVSDSTFAPYSNICPISGRQSVNVWRSGKNLLNAQIRNATTINGIISQVYANDRITISGTATASGDCVVDITPISIGAGQSITISWTGRDTRSANIAVFLHDGSSFYTYKAANANEHSITFDITDAKTIGKLLFRTYTGGTIDFDCNVQIEFGSTATAYEPYQPIQTVTLQLGQTVYGGTVDVVSGVMTVDRAMVQFDGRGANYWNKSSKYPGGFYFDTDLFNDYYHITPRKNTPFLCSHAKTVDNISNYVNGTCYCDGSINIRIMSADTTVAQWVEYLAAQNTAGTPVEICCYLAQPVTVQLTAQQLTSLLGTNNVWSDGGNVTVKYIAKKGE